MPAYIVAHELTQDLSGRSLLCPAGCEKLLSQLALDPYAQTNIFHNRGVYPMDTQMDSINRGIRPPANRRGPDRRKGAPFEPD